MLGNDRSTDNYGGVGDWSLSELNKLCTKAKSSPPRSYHKHIISLPSIIAKMRQLRRVKRQSYRSEDGGGGEEENERSRNFRGACSHPILIASGGNFLLRSVSSAENLCSPFHNSTKNLSPLIITSTENLCALFPTSTKQQGVYIFYLITLR